EVAEVAADVARLAEPEDATPGDELLPGLEVARRDRGARSACIAVCVRGVRSVRSHAGSLPLHGHLPRVSAIPLHCDPVASIFPGAAQRVECTGRITRCDPRSHARRELPGMRAFATHVGCCGICVSCWGTEASCASWSRVT